MRIPEVNCLFGMPLGRIIKDEFILLVGAVRAPGKIWEYRFY